MGFFDRAAESRLVSALTRRLGVRTPSIEQEVRKLSGGNQQKVVFARWLAREPRILILDEPTRGIDVGAKAEIYRLIEELAEAGIAILVISSELPELLGLTDRIVVMRAGVDRRRAADRRGDRGSRPRPGHGPARTREGRRMINASLGRAASAAASGSGSSPRSARRI